MGPSLDLDMLTTPSAKGRTPVNIIYLNTLESEELKQVFLQGSQEHLRVDDQEPPTDSMRLAFVLDEAAPFLPPDPRMPPPKEGLRILMTQGRKYGVGCIIATQSPADLDYRSDQSSTTAVGRFTRTQDIKKVEQIMQLEKGESLPIDLRSVNAGRFLLSSPDNFRQPRRMQTRWLITPHGQPLSIEEVSSLTPEALRGWASGHFESGAKRTGRPRWMDVKETKPDRAGPVGGAFSPEPDLEQQLTPTYSHYNLERDGCRASSC